MINIIGQFLEALFCMYFVHESFGGKKQKYKYSWIAAALLMTICMQAGDRISGNSPQVWLFLLMICPFLYAVFLDRRNLFIKFVICEVPYIILVSFEWLGVAIIQFADSQMELTYTTFLALYIFRRIILKLVLLLAVKFLLNYSIYEYYFELHSYWYVLGSLCLLEFIILYGFRTYRGTVVFMAVNIFCGIVPIMFYYMIYLMGINTKQLQVEVSQKNFIDAQEQYMTQLVNAQDSMRKFRHDYKAHMFCIDRLLLEKNYEELHEYLKHIHDMGENYDHFQFYTEDNRLNIIINQMKDMAEREEILFDAHVAPIEITEISMCDLNMLLSNLYRNALEAAKKTSERRVELLIEKSRAYLKIAMQNSVIENPLIENPDFITSKPEKELHGFGMQIIRNVVEKYQGMLQIDGTDRQVKINILLMDEL